MKNKIMFSSFEMRIIIVNTFLLLVGMLGTDIHLASMPSMVDFFNSTKQEIQLSVPIFLVGIGISSLIYGPLSDKYGRKPIILFGLIFAIASNIVTIFSTTTSFFLMSRLLQGLGSGVCLSLSRVVLGDIIQREKYAIAASYITIFTGLSIVIGPMVGGYLQLWFGWQSNFIAISLMLIVLLVVYVLFFPETNKNKNTSLKISEVFFSYKVILSSRVFLSATTLSGIGLACFILYTTISPFILQKQFYLKPTEYGWLTAFVGIGLLIGRLLLPHIIRNFSLLKVINIGLFILILCGGSLFFISYFNVLNPTSFLFSVAGNLFSYSFIVLCSSAIAISCFNDKRGAAGAIYSCSQMLIAFLITYCVSFLTDNLILVLACVFIILPTIGFYFTYSLKRTVL